jgi:phosphate transport system substrate-binding protein
MKYIIASLMSLITLTAVASAQTISGAGATFPYPVYAKWSDEYKKQTGVSINYQSIGSGAGIKQIKAQTVVFGASDMPLSNEELEKDGLVQFPTVLGAISLVYNIEGISKPLVFDGDTLAKIYMGEIKNWNDPIITKFNPNVNLPNLAIVPVYRSDGSGTTYVFTQYLSAISDTWKTKVGSNTSVKFPIGVGGKGNEGVAATIKQVKGTIGYVEFAYVKQNNLSFAYLTNASGNVTEPNVKSFQSGSGIVNSSNKDAWPITSFTYIIIHKNPKDVKLVDETLKFFDWSYNNGDKIALELDYIPLSKEVKDAVRKEWLNIKRN